MNNLEQFSIVAEMKNDKEFIENFVLETDKGTKRMKEKFYNDAATQRNEWIANKRGGYVQISKGLFEEISRRFPALMPNDCSETYQKMAVSVDKLLYVARLDSDSSNAFKLDLSFILASINDLTSLEDLNLKIRQFIKKFGECGVHLTLEDFKYTMFTEMYMTTFFENSDYDSVKDTFEKIYFKCPDIKLQLKMNLQYLVNKYDKQLGTYVGLLKAQMFNDNGIPEGGDAVARYVKARYEMGDQIATDEFYNAKLFLDGNKKIDDYLAGASTRTKIYNSFALNEDYNSYSDEEKKLFNDAMMGFYLTLNELKKFYRYEFILKELVTFYKDKASAKGTYLAKKKEVEKEEKVREGLYGQYRKALGIGFLARKNENKQKIVMLNMNAHIRKLKELYDQLYELEIHNEVSELEDSSSIYDLFLTSLKSFAFLEKCFSNEDFADKSLEENVKEYLKFIYNPDNGFLRKINGLADYNITDVVAEKYRLLNLNITSEIVSADTIDATFSDVQFINLIQNIERSRISLDTIDNLCKMQTIMKTKSEEQ